MIYDLYSRIGVRLISFKGDSMIGLMFILGIFIGGFIGIFIMSCLQISKYADSDSSNNIKED